MSYIETEREKYEKIYRFPAYGSRGHGAPIAPHLIQRAATRGVLGDFGCGRGGSFQPYLDAGFQIQPVDHVDVLDQKWRAHPNVLPLAVANLWADTLPVVNYGICTDVAEHIPTPHVEEFIANLADAIGTGCLWSICHVNDGWGQQIKDRLHMTVQLSPWWRTELKKHWAKLEVIKESPGTSIYWTSH